MLACGSHYSRTYTRFPKTSSEDNFLLNAGTVQYGDNCARVLFWQKIVGCYH